MPTRRHEVLTELFRHRPSLVAEVLLLVFGIKVPAWQQASVTAGDLNELLPTEYRADSVTMLSGETGEPVLAAVVEVQLRRDRRKLRSWAAYIAMVYARWGCPTVLLVVCAAAATARWASRPIEMGPGSIVTPLVLGPDQIPVVTDPDRATDNPELAVLSAMAHGSHPERERILKAMWGAVQVIDRDHADMYTDLVMRALPEAARQHLEDLMDAATYEPMSDIFRRHFLRGKSEGKAEGMAEGRHEGEADAILTVLAARGVEVPEPARARISGCADAVQLREWARRAATAVSIEDLFVAR